jgi:polysaccharide biosynthesis transport protein
MVSRHTTPEDRLKWSSLDTAFAMWRRRKWLAIFVFAAPMSAALSCAVALPNIYRSTATVLVDREQIPATVVQSTVTGALETRLRTISEEVLSRSRLEALINRFHLYRDLRRRAPLGDVVDRMRRDIKLELSSVDVRGQRQATVGFTISYQGSDPQTVSVVANTLASFYVEENLKARERQASGTAEFLKVQLAETQKRLDDQDRRVSAFKRSHLGELPQQMETNLSSLEHLHTRLSMNADNQARAVERRRALSRQLAEIESVPPPVASGGSGGGSETPETRLARSKQELAKLRAQFSEKYPDIALLAAEVAALEREVDQWRVRDPELAKAKDPEGNAQDASGSPPAAPPTPLVLRLKEALSEADADLKLYKGEEQRLRNEIAAYQARVENVPRREQEFKELSRDYESTRELYQSLLKRYAEAQLSESMEQRQKGEQFRVLDPALPGRQPTAPARGKFLVVTLIGSLGLAAGAVMAAERLDTSFHTADELQAFTAMPVLASIPWIMTQTYLRRRQWRVRLVTAGALVGILLIGGMAYVVAHGNESLVAHLAWGGGS